MLFDYPWVKSFILIVISVIIYLFSSSIYRNPPSSALGRILRLLLIAGADVLAIVILVFYLDPLSIYADTFSPGPEDILTDRISAVSSTLAETSKELSEIQEELETRIEYVQNLKKEAEIAENVISLSEEQVNAIQAKINQEFEANSEKNTNISILINFVFFILGLVVPRVIAVIRKKFFSQKKEKTGARDMYRLKKDLTILEEAKEDKENDSDDEFTFF